MHKGGDFLTHYTYTSGTSINPHEERNRPKARIHAISWLALGWVAVSSLPTQLSLGSFSLSALLTAGTALALLFASLVPLATKIGLTDRLFPRIRHRNLTLEPLWEGRLGHPWVPFPLILFILVAVSSTIPRLGVSFDIEAIQNTSTYALFVLSIPTIANSVSSGSALRFQLVASRVAAAVGIVGLFTTLIGIQLYDARAFGLTALILLAIVIPIRDSSWLVRMAPYVLAASVVVTLSRTASVVAIVMLMFVAVRGRPRGRFLRAVLYAVLAGASLVALWFVYMPFRERFLTGDNAVIINGVSVNTSGRTAIWDVLLSDLNSSPWFGHGAGAAQRAVNAAYPTISHPHSDYLRILYDFGYVGLACFVAGILLLMIRIVSRISAHGPWIHWSALVGLLAVCLSAITDNVLVYPFVMLPLGVIVGYSMSFPPPEKRRRRPTSSRNSMPTAIASGNAMTFNTGSRIASSTSDNPAPQAFAKIQFPD